MGFNRLFSGRIGVSLNTDLSFTKLGKHVEVTRDMKIYEKELIFE